MPSPASPAPSTPPPSGSAHFALGTVRTFIHDLIDADNASGRFGGKVKTRFPPEPNGYLHVGHAKSIALNFGLAKRYGGTFVLRFDDTNPAKEEQEYVDAIKDDVRWLLSAFDAGDFERGPHAGGLTWASGYFDRMYAFAEELIQKGKAYVCTLTGEEVSARRGTPQTPATSPHRDRPPAESLALFRAMRDGKHPTGAMTLRAKIDLASPNFNLRDPVLYRILHEEHHATGNAWCIYPMYDWAHGFEDSIEGITHSVCTLEFENHRPLYDWFIRAVNEGRTPDGSGPWGKPIHHAQQIEFAKFRPTYTVLSKRNLLRMVEEKVVNGWDDPRMPTIRGMRRRGYTARALARVVEEVGCTKVESTIDLSRIENALRDDLNKSAPRAMVVLRPLKVVIDNWPTGKVDHLDFVVNPEDPGAGKRQTPFTREIYVERDDFMETASKGFHRLAPGAEVRLRWAYFIRCTGVDKDAAGNIVAVRATLDEATRGGDAPPTTDAQGVTHPGRKPKGTLHWVSAEHAVPVEVRLFDRLFTAEEPGARTGNWKDDLNPRSLETVTAMAEPFLRTARVGDAFQFERLGYFCVDRDSGAPFGGEGGPDTPLIFNRAVALKDDYAQGKAEKKPAVRMYTLAEAAHELKVKAEKLPALIEAAGPADFAARPEKQLTLDEVRALKAWAKANAGKP
jgi:glutaminyl-tRNA synthetase